MCAAKPKKCWDVGSKEMVSDVIFFSVEHTHFGTDEKSPNQGNSKFGFRILLKTIKIPEAEAELSKN